MPRRTLATAPGYLVSNRRTCCTDVVNGVQADYVLDQIYNDNQVRQDTGGAFVVTTLDWQVIKYVPLHADQAIHRHLADAYDPKMSQDGRTFTAMPRMSGRDVRKYMDRHDGEFWRTRDDFIIQICRGRIVGMWRPASESAEALAA